MAEIQSNNRCGFKNDKWLIRQPFVLFVLGREEATRTPDPYVPNVVRYQLRYFPIPPLQAFFSKIGCKGTEFFRKSCKKSNFFLNLFFELLEFVAA